jgi:3-keto-disaccharide hydrolase
MDGILVRHVIASLLIASAASAQVVQNWPIHSKERPKPLVVDPGPGSLPVPPPKDAVVLFDGTSLAKWAQKNGEAAKWIVRDGYFEVRPGTGDLVTRDGFGDVQLHVEWSSPDPAKGSDQDRGNSGVYLMSKYELQVLDSYHNETYADGQAGALYGQFPPLVNASRPPGQWQSYDIVFHGPRFDSSGRLQRPATMTVLHNGVLVQDHVTLTGPTGHYVRPPYEAHPDKLPILLQDHSHPVRYRNIWLRELR